MTRTSGGGSGKSREGGIDTAKAVGLIAVLLVIGVIVLWKSTGSSSKPAALTTTKTTLAPTPTTNPPSTTTTTLVPPASIKLQVLNGVGTGSYAGEWSAKLKASPGYDTLTPDERRPRWRAP